MTDRELLDLAAKAAGVKLTAIDNLPHQDSCRFWKDGDCCDCGAVWDPLTDDGDALRLAVTLRMEIGFAGDHVAAQRTGGKLMTEQRRDGDVQAATRRAIVRVAAQALEIANFPSPGAAQE
jgi:hypothetical protein